VYSRMSSARAWPPRWCSRIYPERRRCNNILDIMSAIFFSAIHSPWSTELYAYQNSLGGFVKPLHTESTNSAAKLCIVCFPSPFHLMPSPRPSLSFAFTVYIRGSRASLLEEEKARLLRNVPGRSRTAVPQIQQDNVQLIGVISPHPWRRVLV
jgi:hypothetical protein